MDRRLPSLRTIDERNALVVQWRFLAIKVARRFRSPLVELDDAVQLCMLGLIRAAERFDPAAGVSFMTFAYTCIQRRLWSAIRQLLKRSDTLVARSTGSAHRRFTTGLDLDLMLWQRTDNDERPDEGPDPKVVARMHAALAGLAPTYREAVERHYLRGETLGAIGHSHGVTRQAAYNALRHGLRRLRKAMKVESPAP